MDREEFRNQTFGKELPEKGVLFPGEFAGDYWLALSKCYDMVERSPLRGEDYARDFINEFISKIDSNIDRYAACKVAGSGDDTYLKKTAIAKSGLLSALDNNQSAKAAFFAFLLAANAFAYGDWHRFWAYGDLARYDHNLRANSRLHKGLSGVRAEFLSAARSRWNRETECDGRASTTAGQMAKQIREDNSEYLESLIQSGAIKKTPTIETIKSWLLDSGAVPPEVKGKRGRPKKK